jgi:TetR/AcrR family transcriptional regulator, regulator of mycofactocin system
VTVRNKHQVRRENTRANLEQAAWEAFTNKGFAKTTVADIAELAGVSERTFFRHFESKEAVLFGSWRDELETLNRQIVLAPRNEDLLAVVRAAVIALVIRYESQREHNLVRARLMSESDVVADYERRVIQRTWEDTIAGAVAERLGVHPTQDATPHLLGGISVAAVHTAVIVWQHRNEQPLANVVAETFDLLTHLTNTNSTYEETLQTARP